MAMRERQRQRKEEAIFWNRAAQHPARVERWRLRGDFGLYDDGWRARLTLPAHQGNPPRFVSYDRMVGEFDAEWAIGPHPPHGLRLLVHNFNELQTQTYVGYVFTRGPAAITGMTNWKGTPFGFLARPCPPFSIGPERPGPVRPDDYAGTFRLRCDGLSATLRLRTGPEDAADPAALSQLSGELIEDVANYRFPVVATIDPAVPHSATISIHDIPGSDPATLSVWMFVRPRIVVAGWLEWGGMRVGCYLFRTGTLAAATARAFR
jgi:hypothetical protein